MPTYVIAELAEGEKGGYCPRGAAKELWSCKAPAVLLSGPAETGKTFGCCHKLDALLWKYPKCHAAIVRKTQASIYASVLKTYQNVIGDNSPIKAYGGEKPEWFDYPNGSRLRLIGLDNPGRALSSEYDFININQAEELAVEDYEILTSRCTGRAGHSPYAQIMGDCNPGPPTHWIKDKERAGTITLIESRHEDNPTLYDDDGNITAQGTRTMAVLDALSGVRYFRLRKGLWVASEGVVYETWDPAIHLVGREAIPREWPRWWTVDFGYTNPFVWQCWAEDDDGCLWLVHEIYRTHRLVEDHARDILLVSGYQAVLIDKSNPESGVRVVPVRDDPDPLPRAIICDHDAEDRATLARHLGLTTTPAHKTVSDGIQAVQSRLRVQDNGRPRIFIMRDALVESDPELANNRKPSSTAQEFEVYIWDTRPGLKKGDQAVKENDHGMDALRYMVAARDLKPSLVMSSPSVQTLPLERGGIPAPSPLPISSPVAGVIGSQDTQGRLIPPTRRTGYKVRI